MAKIKVYYMSPNSVHNERAENILKEPGRRTNYAMFVTGTTKVEALQALDTKLGMRWYGASDLRVAMGSDSEALIAAGLLGEPGTILITTSNGGPRPIVLINNDGEARAIGILKPSAMGRPAFEAVAADYAGVGSVAVGVDVAYVKGGEAQGNRWNGTDAGWLTDEELQQRIDRGELKIIRSGLGDWGVTNR